MIKWGYLAAVGLLGLIMFCSFIPDKGKIKYTRGRTVPADQNAIQTLGFAFLDTSGIDGLIKIEPGNE